MKWNSIRASLVRYFRPAATSVSPQIEPIADPNDISGPTHPLDDLGNQILKQLRESGMIGPNAEVRVGHEHYTVINGEVRAIPHRLLDTSVDYQSWALPPDTGSVDTRPGIKPPLDAGTNGWTWSQWSKEAASAGTIPGWAFCRFANRLGPENVGFVFGHVRGGFGVWRQPFDVCTSDDGSVDQRSEVLTCITHLNSGMGVGIFVDHATAISAAELAEKVCPGWHGYAPEMGSIWHENMSRTLTAWNGIGICTSVNAHAHDGHGTRFNIYGQDTESLMAGKPERLS